VCGAAEHECGKCVVSGGANEPGKYPWGDAGGRDEASTGVASSGRGPNVTRCGIQQGVCVDAVLWVFATRAERSSGHRFQWLQFLADKVELIWRELCKCRDGEGVHHLDRVPAALRAISVVKTLGALCVISACSAVAL